jgi:hypothetical protein
LNPVVGALFQTDEHLCVVVLYMLERWVIVIGEVRYLNSVTFRIISLHEINCDDVQFDVGTDDPSTQLIDITLTKLGLTTSVSKQKDPLIVFLRTNMLVNRVNSILNCPENITTW